MEVAFSGHEGKSVTLGAMGGVLVGMPVMTSANRAVTPYAAGKAFCGVTVNACDRFAAVRLARYVRLPYTGMAPAVGYQTLVSGGTDKIEADAAGRQFLVVDVDTSAVICGVIL